MIRHILLATIITDRAKFGAAGTRITARGLHIGTCLRRWNREDNARHDE
jgi:hypothetical protein